MAYPKIIYNPGGGDVTLNFTYPPVNKPSADLLTATRNDSVTLSGRKQSFFRRLDTFLNLQMDFVPTDDMDDWQDFLEYALTGGPFSFYPDAALTLIHNDWTLEDTDWEPTRGFNTINKFKLRLRKVLPDSLGS